ncbi:MAG: hypothetical protein ACYCOU_11505 [Sulfobacillus sp.]
MMIVRRVAAGQSELTPVPGSLRTRYESGIRIVQMKATADGTTLDIVGDEEDFKETKVLIELLGADVN